MFYVGILYRICSFMEFVKDNPLTPHDVKESFPKYEGVRSKDILDIAYKGNWLVTNSEDELMLSYSGLELLKNQSDIERLRIQLLTLIKELDPPWAVTATQGREVLNKYAPSEVSQCLDEAGLLGNLDDAAISWWDTLASRYRHEKDVSNLCIGRKGEKLSFDYELKRVGSPPRWVAIDYSNLGYDLVSIVGKGVNKKLLIEVKTTTKSWSNGVFHLSRNEWNVLSSQTNSVLHLWCLSSAKPRMEIIPIQAIAPHVPKEMGSGEWESITCPFSAFKLEERFTEEFLMKDRHNHEIDTR